MLDDGAVLNDNERSDLKRLSGQMNWVVTQTRPDVSFEVCAMSNTGKSPELKMIKQANCALRKMKNKELTLHFPPLNLNDKFEIVVYSDATYASLNDGSSQGTHIVFLKGASGNVCPIAWQSKKLNRVTKSPLASECLAVNEAADAGYFIACMLAEILYLPYVPSVHCYTDSKSLIDNVVSTKIPIDRRFRVDVARLREMCTSGEVKLHWVSGKDQIADSLTKRGSSYYKLFDVLSNASLNK